MSIKLFKTMCRQEQLKPEAVTPELFIVTRTKNSYIKQVIHVFQIKVTINVLRL